MSNISQWSTTAANNNSTSPDGYPEGMAPSGVNDSARENMAATAKWYTDLKGTITTGGTTTAYTLTTTNAHAALTDIALFAFQVNAANTGAATLAVDGLTAKSMRINGNALASGDLRTNEIVLSVYNPDTDVFDIFKSSSFTDADHTKLDGIEASATADQTDAEIRAAVEAATDSNVFTDADHTKLDGIEASADVTDTTNVTAAGALMDSELTDIAAVKALNQGVATTDNVTFNQITGTLQTAAQPNVTSLGTLTSLTVDNITVNGAEITSDTGAISFGNENLSTTGTLACGVITATGSGNKFVSASSGATANTSADEGIFEGSGQAGISILHGASDQGNIFFGNSTGQPTDGRIVYYGPSHATLADQMVFFANNAVFVYFDPIGAEADFQANAITTTGTLAAGDVVGSGTVQILNASPSIPSSGTGLELYYASGTFADGAGAYLISYDRDLSAYKPMIFDASSYRFTNPSGTVTMDSDLTLSEGKVSITDTANEVALNIASSMTNSRGMDITVNSLAGGIGLRVQSNTSSTATSRIFEAKNDNTAATGTTPIVGYQDAANEVMILDQNANSSFIDYQGSSAAGTTTPISTHGTAGTLQGWIQIEVNGTKRWMPFYDDPSA